MKSKILILLLLVVVLPTTLLSWGGFQLARQQSSQIENRVRELMGDQLSEVDARIKKYFAVQEALLQKSTSRSLDSLDTIRETADSVGVIDNIFIITPNDVLSYPNPISPLNQRELDFYQRIKTIVEDGEIQNRVRQANTSSTKKTVQKLNYSIDPSNANLSPVNAEDEQTNQEPQILQESISPVNPGVGNSDQTVNRGRQQRIPFQSIQDAGQLDSQQELNWLPQQSSGRSQQRSIPQQRGIPQQSTSTNLFSNSDANQGRYEVCEGWFIWYWGRGVNLIFWQRLATGNIVCVALERSRWMSDLIAELPDSIQTSGESKRFQNRATRIVNSNGDTVYQWGNAITDQMLVAAEIPVSHPLTSWKLQMWVAPEELKSQSLVGLNILLGIVASSIALVAVAWIFYREYAKDLQEASRRVSFVNQVSHELRTPLTNIRMYAELLRQQLDELDDQQAEQARKRIEVVESESNRLSRLIGNVLTFAGSQKKKLEIRFSNGVIDDCVKEVLSSFAPNLERLKIRIEEELNCGEEVKFDSDALGQMIGNLISNVEKYAAEGEVIQVETKMDGQYAAITIKDGGPGIEAKHADKIFEPFWRSSNELQHASGTGIGLSISRELARMHGGDLTLQPAKKGACFEIRIKTEKVG